MKKPMCHILLLMVFALSCRKITDTEPAFTSASYPLSVGNWWQYQFINLYSGGWTDTFILSIDSMSTFGPYTQYFCIAIANGTSGPVGYFQQSDTSISFVNVPNSYFVAFPSFHLKFPVEAGQYWPGAFRGDSILVVGAVNSCQVKKGAGYNTVGPCYDTNESYDLPHNSKVEGMMLVTNVGLTNQNIDFNSDTAEGGIQLYQSIHLINYHVQ